MNPTQKDTVKTPIQETVEVSDGEIKAQSSPFIFNANNEPFKNPDEAKNEFRVRKLSTDTWTIIRTQSGDGFVIAKIVWVYEQAIKRQNEGIKKPDAGPRKYWKISVHASGDPLKPDQISQPVVVNGEVKILYLNSKAIVDDCFLEVLNNSVRPNMAPRTGRKDGDTFELIGWKSRVNFSVIGEATQAEYDEYSKKNKDRFDKFQLEQAKEQPTKPNDI